MEPLRCWSMLPTRGDEREVYCNHYSGHWGACGGLREGDKFSTSWDISNCAPDHCPAGRLSVAHRLLELSWRVMLLDHRQGIVGVWAERLRAMGARMRMDRASCVAAEDLARIADARAKITSATDLEAWASYQAGLTWVLDAAEELLRPFAMEAGR